MRWHPQRAAFFGAATSLLLLAACSDEPGEPLPACPRPAAAFRLEVTAQDGIMPEDTEIVVRYQGSQEERFELGRRPEANEDICCRPAAGMLNAMPAVRCPGDGAPDSGLALAVYCELWTSGIAEVTVRGGTYPDLVETLQAVARDDDCGLETTPVRLVLSYPDGGS